VSSLGIRVVKALGLPFLPRLDTSELFGLRPLLLNKNQEIANLTNKDVLVFIGGTNDINSDISSRDQWHISQFVNQNMQTNIILLTIPFRYDRTANAYVNEKITEVNRKI
jgi:hypothetical protein